MVIYYAHPLVMPLILFLFQHFYIIWAVAIIIANVDNKCIVYIMDGNIHHQNIPKPPHNNLHRQKYLENANLHKHSYTVKKSIEVFLNIVFIVLLSILMYILLILSLDTYANRAKAIEAYKSLISSTDRT